MSRISLRLMSAALVVIGGLFGQDLFANTKVAVGPVTCQPTLVHFPTIQSAVNAVPTGSVERFARGRIPSRSSSASHLRLTA